MDPAEQIGVDVGVGELVATRVGVVVFKLTAVQTPMPRQMPSRFFQPIVC